MSKQLPGQVIEINRALLTKGWRIEWCQDSTWMLRKFTASVGGDIELGFRCLGEALLHIERHILNEGADDGNIQDQMGIDLCIEGS